MSTRILYSRLKPIPSSESKKSNTTSIDHTSKKKQNREAEEQQVGLLVPDATPTSKQFEPPIPSKLSRLVSSISSYDHKSLSTDALPRTGGEGFNAVVSRRLRSPCFMLFLVAIGMFSAITEFRKTNSFSVERRIDNPFHHSPSEITTQIGSKMKNSSSTSLDDVQLLGIPLPISLQFLRESNVPLQAGDVPFFFHIPRSGGSTVSDIMGKCLGLVIASQAGAGHDENALEIYSSPWGSKYANVDTTTISGIVRAHQLSMMQSGVVDFVSCPFLHEGGYYLFNANHQGRMFTMIRHPVDRAVSLFRLEMAQSSAAVQKNETDGDVMLDSFSLARWAHSDNHDNHNWMTRHLSNHFDGDLLPAHLETAKEILRRFCIIGLLESKDESMRRILQYFNLELNSDRSIACKDRILNWGWRNKITYAKLDHESPVFKTLAKMNAYDMELYEFARRLFIHQAKLFE